MLLRQSAHKIRQTEKTTLDKRLWLGILNVAGNV